MTFLDRAAALRQCRAVGVVVSILFLSACSSDLFEYSYPENRGTDKDAPVESASRADPGVFGGSEVVLFGKTRDKTPGGIGRAGPGGGGSGVAVNSFLWRASLDTISFMPLSSADPFGGVIITDWYTPPETPGERFKMNIYILGRQLRADGVRVAVFRQTRGTDGWVDVVTNTTTNTHLENQILTRARQLRVATASN